MGEKLVWQHHCQAWCLCLPAELEASGRACVHEQTCKQKGVTRNPEGCLRASKADGARVRSMVQTNFFLNSTVSRPEKTLVSSDGRKGTEGACWKQGGGVLSVGDPEAAGCREGLRAPLCLSPSIAASIFGGSPGPMEEISSSELGPSMDFRQRYTCPVDFGGALQPQHGAFEMDT
ncbi:uncharacterized protein LOC121233774 isoform X2 [Aquila chrysaetos chrysaetos]|uniref:uncharacterized protein LOC121233774 isoform X2 n=1 Tax=Aquila chrysaetos chrysaetos TaxID=223781 RepID=UPI001B7D3CD6|nr:uncharacterized protein LOC121233774 isoform X2 [Aquila chrysaetos chrysaetos]